jgi:hypothetical protein
VFCIDVLAAERGDCLWVSYGPPEDLHYVIIDGGPEQTITTLVPELEQRIAKIPGKKDRVDLLVVTHVDVDHIQGIVALLSVPARLSLFQDVWYNGREHLGMLGAVDGERLTAILRNDPDRWNRAFSGQAVVVDESGPLPVKTLAGGMKITLLSPSRDALAALIPEWESACSKAGLVAGQGAEIERASWQRSGMLGTPTNETLAATPFRADTGKPNASSIAFIAEYAKKRVLFLGDAPAKSILAALERFEPGGQRIDFDVVKLSHHGSKRNLNLALAERIRSPKWIVSTNGARFEHPNRECLARVIVTQDQPTFVFNYDPETLNDDVQELILNRGTKFLVKSPTGRNGMIRGVRVTLAK